MLTIKSKKEVEEAVHENVNRFKHAKKALIEKNLQRDEAIIISEILPRLRHTIALTHYVRKVEWFHFSLPMMDLEGHDLSQEEKAAVMQAYYHQEGVLWVENGRRGEIGKASLVKTTFEEILQTNVAFKSCEVNVETNTVDFKLHLVDKMLKLKVKEEQAAITAVMDEYLLPHLHFNKVADVINEYYESLKEEALFVLYKRDLEFYPILSLNIDEILNETAFYADVDLVEGDFKIDIRQYVKESKLLKALQRKLKKYGYGLRYATKSSDEWFRLNGIEVSVDAYYPSKDVKDESLVKSEQLLEAFEEKRAEYVETLNQKAQKQNDKLVELVESGHFDEMVTTKWLKATLMSTGKLTDAYFKGERRSDEELNFRFTVPFDRELPKAKDFNETHYKGDGVGIRYMNLENNLVDALRKRYPFFENARFFGERDLDFQAREGSYGTSSYRVFSDTLAFGFEVGHATYVLRKEEILHWLASAYGVLSIEGILKAMDFHEAGVSDKIEAFVHQQQGGKIKAKEPFQIIVGSITSDQLLNLYKESPLSAKSKALFEDEHQDSFWSYWRLKEAYKKAKKEEFQSLKRANLFVHALLVHPLYVDLKEALKAFDYELKVEYKKEQIERMETGNTNINGGDIPDDVCTYSVQIVIV